MKYLYLLIFTIALAGCSGQDGTGTQGLPGRDGTDAPLPVVDLCLITLPENNLLLGIVTEDMTITLADSPYNATGSTLRLASYVTLTIEAGVEIYGGSILVDGILEVAGTKEQPVIFHDAEIQVASYEEGTAEININYAVFNKGKLLTKEKPYFSSSIRNSVFQKTDSILIYRPLYDITVERNIFLNAGGLTIGTQSAIVTVRNNYMYNPVIGGTSVGGILNEFAYSGSVIVEYNSFVNISEQAIGYASDAEAASIAADSNYWGTIDPDTITDFILDSQDNGTDVGDGGTYYGFIIDSNPLIGHHAHTPIPADLNNDGVPDAINACL